jgi:hypothetical protein
MENVRAVSQNLAFVILRDYYGTTQVVVETEDMMAAISPLNKETVIEVQGVVKQATRHGRSYDRSYDNRTREYTYRVTVEVSIINKETGMVLQDGRPYIAETTFLGLGDDVLTGRRNAAPRLAADLARQIVDDVTSWPYNKPTGSGRVEGVQK